MSQVVSIRLTDDLAAELEKRGKSQGETIGVYIQEALKKLVENQPATSQEMREITIDLPEGFACFVEQWPAFKGRSVSELAGEMITAHAIVTSWQEMVRAFRARNDNA